VGQLHGVTGEKWDRGCEVKGGEPGGEVGGADEGVRLLYILLILVWKNERKELHCSVVKDEVALSQGLICTISS